VRRRSNELEGESATSPYYDVNDDGHISSIDALLIINYLNSQQSASEGESASLAAGLQDGANELMTLLAFDIATQSPRRRII
jgi:hypothetical protein